MQKHKSVIAMTVFMVLSVGCLLLFITYAVVADPSNRSYLILSITGLGATASALLSCTIGFYIVAQQARKTHNQHLQTLKQIQASTVSSVETARAKASRHEYLQETALSRLEDRLARVEVMQILNSASGSFSAHNTGKKCDVLFVTSNGAGLGHLTRAISIANGLPKHLRTAILTLSTAYEHVKQFDIPVHYFPSAQQASVNDAMWNNHFRSYFAQFAAVTSPKVVVFDGVWVYTGITEVCRALQIPLVWLQRGCWKEDVDATSKVRHHAQLVSDHVIVPGDHGCPETVDPGPNIQIDHISPVVMYQYPQLADPITAKRTLGLDENTSYILLNLGTTSATDFPDLVTTLATSLESLPDAWKVVLLRSPLTKTLASKLPQVEVIQHYPISHELRAFDVVIAAAGYNSVQEIAEAKTLSVLVPNLNTTTDDQLRRAKNAADSGWALYAETTDQVILQIRKLTTEPHLRSTVMDHLLQLPKSSGAKEAAKIIASVVEKYNWAMLQTHAPSD